MNRSCLAAGCHGVLKTLDLVSVVFMHEVFDTTLFERALEFYGRLREGGRGSKGLLMD